MAGREGAMGAGGRADKDDRPAPVASPSVADAPSAIRPKIEVFGKYRILGEMGHGGMADVYLVVDVGPAGVGKLQVIKRLRPALAEDTELRLMLLDEARLAMRLNHRNVVQTVEVGAVEDRHFIAMELLDGQPLNRILRRCKSQGASLPLPMLLRTLSEVLAGLHYAHEARDYDGQPLKVVHRDVSPHNVFVTYDGQVKVMDFGIAKAARRVVETETGIVRGKVAYMAPEQALPKTTGLDRRADLFSVGVMLWEGLTGERMWGGRGDPEILLKLSTAGAPPLPARADIPRELGRICKRALMRHAEQRYATAAEMRADIDAYLQEIGGGPSPEALGEHVASLFEEDRARVQKIIERQLATLRETEGADEPTWTSSRTTGDAPAAKQTSDAGAGNGGASGGSRSPSSDPAPASISRSRRSGSGPARWVMVAAIVVAAGAAFAMRDRILGQPPAVAAPPDQVALPASAPGPTGAGSTSAPAGSTGASEDRGTIKVRIAATPPGARITLDGITVGENPFQGRLVRDTAMHRLLVEANGFLPHGRMVSFADDVDLDIALLPRERPSTPDERPPASSDLKPR
ncbi:MAG: serine/threonine-protein kinase [Polyangiaceae bacterium]